MEVPDLVIAGDPAVIAQNSEVVEKLEVAMEGWARAISTAVEQLKTKPQGHGPLAEIDFWRERSAMLSMFYEQLKSPAVQDILTIL